MKTLIKTGVLLGVFAIGSVWLACWCSDKYAAAAWIQAFVFGIASCVCFVIAGDTHD